MSLRSLMEERQLDFNQPFLSVRKLSSAAPPNEHESKRQAHVPKFPKPPLYKSDLKSGPMRNPGTVPFVWEQSPGRRKDEKGPENQFLEQSPVAPKLPPGRSLNAKHQANDSKSDDAATTQYYSRSRLGSSFDVSNLERHVSKDEGPKEVVEEARSSASEDGTDAYVDALDTLSRSESFFLNCSISGVSGPDGPEIKPFGAFSSDSQARDFMMGRFLPAAKAMASENPPFTARKQPVVHKQLATQELPGHVQKVVGAGTYQSVHPHRQDNIQHNVHNIGVEETEDDDDGDDDYGHDNSLFKVCGLFPRLCLQNSLSVLNPVPGMRKQAQAPVSSVRATKRTQYPPSYVEAHIKRDVREQHPLDGFRVAGVEENRNNRARDVKQISNAEELDGSSIYNRILGNSNSPYHQESHQSVTHDQNGVIGNSERYNNSEEIEAGSSGDSVSNFRDLLAKEKIEWESGSASPTVERTVYIDTVNVVRPQSLMKSSSGDIGGIIDYEKDNGEGNDKENVETSSMHSSVQDVNLVHVGEKAKVRHLSSESVDSSYLSVSDIHEKQMDLIDCTEQHQDFVSAEPKLTTDGNIDLESHVENSAVKSQSLMVSNGDSISAQKLADSGKVAAECKLSLKPENSDDCNLLLYLPPPLPKSPSESWLQRTLPTFSSRTPSSRSTVGLRSHPGQQNFKMNAPDLRWETVVRASNIQHGHLQFSEELLAPIPEI